jgi:predicted house-cleaning noncanonical NTP pyrophosphatase (MazG superfamily)
MRVTYHKLIRDQIPGIIAADGGQPVTRILDHAGYEAALRAKLLEEAHEAQAAPDSQLASELADVLEVLKALARTASQKRRVLRGVLRNATWAGVVAGVRLITSANHRSGCSFSTGLFVVQTEFRDGRVEDLPCA